MTVGGMCIVQHTPTKKELKKHFKATHGTNIRRTHFRRPLMNIQFTPSIQNNMKPSGFTRAIRTANHNIIRTAD